MNGEEFNDLLAAMLDGDAFDDQWDFDPESLSPEQRRELVEFLSIEPQLRDAFSQPGSFAAGVMKALECDDPADRREFREAIVRGGIKRRGISRKVLWKALPWGIAAVVTMLLVASFLWRQADPVREVVDRTDGSVPPAATFPAAILVAEAEFDPLHAPDGVRYESKQYVLRSGWIHLRLLNGVDIAIEGPARFVLRDPFQLDLEQELCSALVPESGHGFTVNTSQMKVIDLGTEFGVSVDPDGRASEVRVFDGKVDVIASNSTEKTRLNGNDALRISSTEGVTAPRIGADDFPDILSIAFLQWQQWRNKIAQDPDLIAYLPMQHDRKGRVEVISTLPEAPVAQLNGARRVAGRWPGKGALLFDGDGDSVELDLGMNHEEFTIAMWVKADRWDYKYAALANSNGWGPGALHLQVTSEGAGQKKWRVHGSIRKIDVASSVRAYSVEAMEIGRWHHVAYVLSQRAGQFQVFLDGVIERPQTNLVHIAVAMPENTPINPGVMRLGDWQMDLGFKAARPQKKGFRGRIDEFVAIARALSQEEIDEMVTRGRPRPE